MVCRNPALSRQKRNIKQPTAHAVLLAAPGKNGHHGPPRAEWESARAILQVMFVTFKL